MIHLAKYKYELSTCNAIQMCKNVYPDSKQRYKCKNYVRQLFEFYTSKSYSDEVKQLPA